MMWARRAKLAAGAATPVVLWLVVGCGGTIRDWPLNPSFPVTMAAGQVALADAARRPVRLGRPVLVVGGFADPGLGSRMVRDRLRRATGDERVVDVSLCYDRTFDQCRRDIVAAVDASYPCADPAATAEVDVVGLSMGGIAAEYAALPAVPGDRARRRLRIARLFTLGSPLRGATLADRIPVDLHPLQPDMRTGSWVYQRLAAAPVTAADVYPVYSYVRLGDDEVGQANAAAPGRTPWWVSAPPWPRGTHHATFLDARLLADVALRLRGEAPLSRDPPAAFPARRGGG